MKVPSRTEQGLLQEEFLERVKERLDAGRQEYGDATLLNPPEVLRGELEQELFDVAGWAYVLWVRVRSLSLAEDSRSVAERIREENARWLEEEEATDEQTGFLH